jgi:hypothetical protein
MPELLTNVHNTISKQKQTPEEADSTTLSQAVHQGTRHPSSSNFANAKCPGFGPRLALSLSESQ